MRRLTHDAALSAFAASLDRPEVRFWFLLALVAGATIAAAVALLWALTRPRRACLALMRLVRHEP